MKTAVEFLIDEINDQLNISFPGAYLDELMIQDAKEIFEHQIKRAYLAGCLQAMNEEETTPEQYYNETYKNTDK